MLRPIPIAHPLVALLAALPAQRADSFDQWSTYLGGTDVNLHAAVAHGPGGLVTVAGTTRSPNMATPGAFQTTLGGDADAFVARFDPSLPPAQQLLCTPTSAAAASRWRSISPSMRRAT